MRKNGLRLAAWHPIVSRVWCSTTPVSCVPQRDDTAATGPKHDDSFAVESGGRGIVKHAPAPLYIQRAALELGYDDKRGRL